MLIALDVRVIDRRRGRVQVENGRSLRMIATGDHHGCPCSTIVASYAVALDDDGAYAIDVTRMTAHPLGAVASLILVGGVVVE